MISLSRLPSALYCPASTASSVTKQLGQLSQANRAAACISFGKNVSAKACIYHRSILRHWRRQM